MQIDGYTRLAAVVATPIKHSISPFIHNQAFQETGINGVYLAWDIQEQDLLPSLENIKRYDMFGINLSMPYKHLALPYMDELSEAAQLIGAINTVIHRDGKLIGHNTDGLGFFKSLDHQASFDVCNKSMTILGAGGAGMAIIAQAILNGAKSITIFKRRSSLKKTREAIKHFSSVATTKLEVLPMEDENGLQNAILQSDLLINATNVGMDGTSLILPQDTILPPKLLVADIIYQPFETPLLAFARKQGVNGINGLGMLLFQAAEAFEAWTQTPMPTDKIWKQLEERYRTNYR